PADKRRRRASQQRPPLQQLDHHHRHDDKNLPPTHTSNPASPRPRVLTLRQRARQSAPFFRETFAAKRSPPPPKTIHRSADRTFRLLPTSLPASRWAPQQSPSPPPPPSPSPSRLAPPLLQAMSPTAGPECRR